LGVVGTFVTQTTPNLQPDNSQITVSLLTELISLQRAVGSGGNVSSVPASPLAADTPFSPTSRDLWLNGVWFVSLALTLMMALMIGIVKQWLAKYLAGVTGSACERSCTREFRYQGMSFWGVALIVELLPMLMNAALLLFFVGLILYLQDLTGNGAITKAIIILTCIIFGFYVVTSALPILVPQCPYHTSLTSVLLFPFRMFQLLGLLLPL
jgi:hypothetical protein